MFYSGIFIFSVKNMLIDVTQIQAFELLVVTRRQKQNVTFHTCLLWFGQQRKPSWGTLSAWVLSNIPLFNQAYCWLALRYTVLRYFIH